MNLKYFKIISNTFLIIFSSIAITLLQFQNIYALEADQNTPKVNIGVGGLFGFCSVNHYGNNNMNWDPGYAYGGGIVFENMFTGTFGLHSGLWFTHSVIKAKFSDKDSGTDIKIEHKMTSNIITLPIFLITSFDSRNITLNLLTGLNFSYIAETYMKPNPDNGSNNSNTNITKFLGYGQIGAGAGIEFLFKITKFTRLFITFTGEYYFVNLISDQEDGSIDHLYGANVRAGIMLCTF
jgi:hypothetical protein